MRNKIMSIFVCAMIVVSISSSITQNVGEMGLSGGVGLVPSNISAPVPQVVGQPSLSSGGSGGLADSPWPMFRQNLNHTGVSPYDTSGNLGKLKWSFSTDSQLRSSSSIDMDGTIYIGSFDNKLYAINPDGTEKWNLMTGGIVRSSPAIGSDGTIYVGSDDHKLYAINPDGSEKWNFETGYSLFSSPVIDLDGTIYVGSNDCKLYAINPDGTEKWSFATLDEIGSSPAIGSDGTIYIGSDDQKLYAINPDGSEIWSFVTGGVVSSSPAIGSDGTIYIGSHDDKLYAINPNGTEKWSFVAGGVVSSSPAIGSDGTIYVGSWDNKVYAINPNGTEKWNLVTDDSIRSSPAIGSDDTIYIGCVDYKLYAINPVGVKKWNFTTGWVVWSSPAIGSDGTIYIGSWDGNLYAIGNPSLCVSVTSHFTSLNSAAQSAITVHVTDSTNPVQGATVNLDSDNGGIFSPPSGITDANGDFKSIFNAPTVTSQIICRISVEASKTGYNNGSGYVDVTVKPIPWPMFHYNINHTGQSPYDTSTNNGQLKWSFTTGDAVCSSPAIGSDGTIYVGSYDDKVYAINPDGIEKWNFTTGFNVYSSPAIGSDSTIYVGSDDNKLYAINPDGTEKWSFTAGNYVHSSPAINSDGTIYVGSDDYKLYAINPDGTEKWNFTTDYYIYWSSPAIGFDDTIYVCSGDFKLYAIKPDGTEKWSFMTGSLVHSSPTIGSDGTIYVGSDDHKLYAINLDGTEKWNLTTGGPVSTSPAIDSNGTIYVGSSDYNVYAIKPDGTEKWSFTTGGPVSSSPAIGSDGTIYVGSYDHNVYAINPDGTKKWNFITGDWIRSSPAIGSDTTIYVGSDDGKLYAIGTPSPNIAVEKTANVTHAKPGDTITYTIYYNNTPTSDPIGELVHQQLTFEDSDQRYPSYSPDGSEIVFSSFEDGGSYMDIWVMDADGSNHQQLTFENASQEDPSFSPDGSKIVYYSYEDLVGGEDIWIMNSDGSNHQQLTDVETQRYPTFSPDGSKIVYISQEDGGVNYDIWIMNSDGTNHQQLTFEDVEQFYPSFNLDGNKIVYSSKEDGGAGLDIWIINTDGSNRQQLTFENDNQYYPSFSPDGSKIVYSSYEDGGMYEDIWVMNADGSDHQQLTNEDVDQLWPTFSPDGEKIIYQSKEDGGSYYDIWILTMSSETIAKTVWINDTLPPDVTFVTSSAEANRTGNYNWTFYDVEPGEHNFTITVQVNAGVPNGTILTNYAHLDCTNYKGNPMLSSSDSVDVIVIVDELIPPVADAGHDQIVNESDVVQFNGSASYDPDVQVQEILSESQPNITYPYPWGGIGIFLNAEINASQGVIFDSKGNLSRIDIYLNIRDNFKSEMSYNVVLSFTDELGNLLGTTSQMVNYVDKWYIFRFSEPIPLVAECLYFISIEAPDPDAFPMWNAIAVPGIDPYPKAHGYLNGTILDDFAFKTYLAGNEAQALKYEWDFESDGIYDYKETPSYAPDGAFDGITNYTYGDDGIYEVTLKVTDDQNLTATDTCNVTVQNVDPTVTIDSITMDIEIGLRVAGRKYNNVSMTLYEEGNIIGYVSIERLPGSPNEQMAWIPVSINFSKSYNATVTYTPEDPPNIGGNPVWIYLKSKDGTINKIHHTFNVQQSKKRDSEHWNHVEPWEVDLNEHFIGLPFEITSQVTDPGSDDEILTFTYGSQTVNITYLNNPPNPDPYPSPEVKPMDIFDVTILTYEGAGAIMLVVKDDDNVRSGVGEGTDSINIPKIV